MTVNALSNGCTTMPSIGLDGYGRTGANQINPTSTQRDGMMYSSIAMLTATYKLDCYVAGTFKIGATLYSVGDEQHAVGLSYSLVKISDSQI